MPDRPEDIYSRYAQTVYRFLFSLSGNADTAEELTQETFYQALKSMDTYRGASSLQVWLCAIAKRLYYKELQRRRRHVQIDDAAMQQLSAPVDLEQDYARQESRLALYRAMQQLDADTREVIHLRLAGTFSFREIGEILGRSEAWARVRFYRGKESLARILGGDRRE